MNASRLPAKATAAVVVTVVYLLISVIGIFQILSITSEYRSSSVSRMVTIIVLLTVALMAAFVVGLVFVVNRRTVVPLRVITGISLGLSLVQLRTGSFLVVAISAVPLIVILVLLGSPEVRDFFNRQAYLRNNLQQLIDSNR